MKNYLGIVIGTSSFLPVFVLSFILGIWTNIFIGIVIMIISQFLWLTGISLCTRSLEEENRVLKSKLSK